MSTAILYDNGASFSERIHSQETLADIESTYLRESSYREVVGDFLVATDLKLKIEHTQSTLNERVKGGGIKFDPDFYFTEEDIRNGTYPIKTYGDKQELWEGANPNNAPIEISLLFKAERALYDIQQRILAKLGNCEDMRFSNNINADHYYSEFYSKFMQHRDTLLFHGMTEEDLVQHLSAISESYYLAAYETDNQASAALAKPVRVVRTETYLEELATVVGDPFEYAIDGDVTNEGIVKKFKEVLQKDLSHLNDMEAHPEQYPAFHGKYPNIEGAVFGEGTTIEVDPNNRELIDNLKRFLALTIRQYAQVPQPDYSEIAEMTQIADEGTFFDKAHISGVMDGISSKEYEYRHQAAIVSLILTEGKITYGTLKAVRMLEDSNFTNTSDEFNTAYARVQALFALYNNEK